MELFELSNLSDDPLYSGGFSGLNFEKVINGEELIFWSHSDRGPNGKKIKDPINNVIKRPFLKPDFQPFWIRFSLNRRTGEVSRLDTIHLRRVDGKPLTGLPNKVGDEVAIDMEGNELEKDIYGIDPESICFEGNNVWMGEEYGPSLLKFDRTGKLLKRFVPKGTYQGIDSDFFKDVLPEDVLRRKVNRGFEGLTCHNGKIYAILQSPLKDEGNLVRILEFNPIAERVERQLLYPLDKSAEKIGALSILGSSLLVLEQNGEVGPESIHRIYAVNIEETEEGHLKKRPVKDLVKEGYSFAEKVEGLAVINEHELAVVNDNDFSVNDPNHKTVLGIAKID